MPKSPIRRILSIVKYLYLSKSLKVTDLSKEYNVSEKTIRRDLKKIGEVIPLANKRGIYSIDRAKLFSTSLNYDLLLAFASNADISFECFEKSNLTQERITFAIEFNHLPKRLAEGLLECIDKGYKCSFVYTKTNESSKRIVSPIKFYTEKERWYLIAKDDKDSKIKTFYFGKISNFLALVDSSASLTQQDIDEANNRVSVWSDSSKKEQIVRLYVKPKVAEFILDGKLHKSQKIIDEHYDGGLEVEYIITHELEILPRLMSYFPYIHILEPQWLRERLKKDIEIYQKEMSEMDI